MKRNEVVELLMRAEMGDCKAKEILVENGINPDLDYMRDWETICEYCEE